jgi:hypothetical protein
VGGYLLERRLRPMSEWLTIHSKLAQPDQRVGRFTSKWIGAERTCCGTRGRTPSPTVCLSASHGVECTMQGLVCIDPSLNQFRAGHGICSEAE